MAAPAAIVLLCATMKLDRCGPQAFDQLWAFMLSTAAHFSVVGFALGSGMWVDNTAMPSSHRENAVMMAGLYAPDSVTQSRLPVIAISNDEQLAAESVYPRTDATEAIAQKKDEAENTRAFARSADTAYLPVTELTRLPSVILDIPADFSLPSTNGAARLAILHLLINQNGDVDQVVVEDAPVSEQEQNLLKDVFSKTKFHAGEVNGMAVKSQLRIEVLLQ
jgi:hypothetical protein